MRITPQGFTALVAFSMFFCGSGAVVAQQPESPLTVDDLLSALQLTDTPGSLSPDGEWLAYTLQDPRRTAEFDSEQLPFGAEGDRTGATGSDIWITATKTGTSSKLTGGIGSSWAPVWSPNGKYLAFYSTRGGNTNVWIYDVRTERLRCASQVPANPFGSEAVAWTPDSNRLLSKLATDNKPAANDLDRKPSGGTLEHHLNSRVTLYRSLPTGESRNPSGAQDPGSVVEDSRTRAEEADLGLIDVSSGKVERIARGFNPVWYRPSPDGSQIALASYKGLRGGNRYRDVFDLMLVDADGKIRRLSSDITWDSWDFSASWSPNGKWLSYITVNEESASECWIVPTDAGHPRELATEAHPVFANYFRQPPLWDSSGENLYFLASWDSIWRVALGSGKASEVARLPGQQLFSIVGAVADGRFWSPAGRKSMIVTSSDPVTKKSGFYRIDLETSISYELQKEDKFYNVNQMLCSREGSTIVYVAEDAGHEPNFWIMNGDLARPQQLTNINPQLTRHAMGRSMLIEWQGLDGQLLRGALLLPVGYRTGQKYPLVVNVYGGQAGSSWLNHFGLFVGNYPIENKQLLATRGYAVLLPDAPVGAGTSANDLVKTVLPGVNKIVELGIADPNSLGIMGQSYGGYSALSLIAQTTRFKAAIMISGLGDLVGFYGEMENDGASLGGLLEEPWWPGRMPGSLWKSRESYIENSPIFYLDRVQTPLLILHGASDRNAAPFLGDQVFVFLRRLGKDVVYAKYRGEGHAISGYGDQLDYCDRIITWFDTHLKTAASQEDNSTQLP